ncbi:hypothetical protein SSX86_018692 [Deinandra increscens subsp. villosa]|uniref:BHLH domain-containing protein n=1 Tax=Deinandra increscens subsp. villosa TaxID=3103831 RepID=A0AAP0CR84_9ASTR
MNSDIHHLHLHHNHQQQQAQQNMNSGLTRYRSAPSSYFANLINSGTFGDEDLESFFNPRISSPETERIPSRFTSIGDGNEFMASSMKRKQVNFSSQSQEQKQIMYQNHARSQELVRNNDSVMVDRLTAMDPPANLLRQSSSPAGFLEQIISDNGYNKMRSRGELLTRIPENEGRSMTHNNGGYVASFSGGSWNESSMLSDGFLDGFVENDQISSSQNEEKLNDEGRIQSIHAGTGLTHQLSLPTQLSTNEKPLQFQDNNVTLRSSRAKRGCATHPRSIAERVRRTRISERMRKLQDLVPNMDKQTITADMLDLAVDYIKQLQNQVETLSNHRTNCTCQNKWKP